MKHFFTVTNGTLALLASGPAFAAVRFLVQGDLLSSWRVQLWDASRLLPNGSLMGLTLGIVTGCAASPAGIQGDWAELRRQPHQGCVR